MNRIRGRIAELVGLAVLAGVVVAAALMFSTAGRGGRGAEPTAEPAVAPTSTGELTFQSPPQPPPGPTPTPGKLVSPAAWRVLFRASVATAKGPETSVRSVNADGGDEKVFLPAEELGTHGANMVISPDGTRIVSGPNSNRSIRRNALYLMNADGTGKRILVPPITEYSLDAYYPARAIWSWDGNRIAFVKIQSMAETATAGQVKQLWKMNADGSEQEMIANSKDHPDLRLVLWAPRQCFWAEDGRIYAVTSDKELVSLDTNNGTVTKIAGGIEYEGWAISRDGRRIVAQGQVPAEAIQRAGFQPVPGLGMGEKWNADLTRVAYELYVSGPGGILFKDLITGEEKLLFEGVEGNGCPCYPLGWSPDGEFLAYSAHKGNIYVVRVADGQSWLVGPNPGAQAKPRHAAVHFIGWVRGSGQ